MKKYLTIKNLLPLVPAFFLLKTLYFKFTAHPASVAIFTELGVEPWGRIITGVLELIASMLILFPKTRVYGALGVIFVMSGAIASHVFILGINFMGDKGALFITGVIALISSLCIIYFYEKISLRKMFYLD